MLHVLHLIFALDPKCSGRVNRSRQSIRDFGAEVEQVEEEAVWPSTRTGLCPGPEEPRSREMSQKGSIVVDTFL